MSRIPYVELDPSCSFLAHTIASSLDAIDIVERPAAGRYVTALPVKDYLNLTKSGDEGLLALLQPEDLDAVRTGRTLLMLDLSNEGPEFYAFIFDIFHSELSRLGIAREHVVFVSQNRWLGRAYERYYGVGMRFWSCDYFPKAIAVWMRQGGGAATDFPLSDYQPLRADGAPRFLSLNAAARWHRLLLYRWLQVEGLLDEGLVSFHGVNSQNAKSNEIDLAAPPPEVAETFPELLAGIADWMPPAPQILNRAPASGNQLIMTVDREAYAQSLLSIVTESDFFAPGVERLTEKSLKAAGMGHPFIIIGPPRTVSKLAELGFSTFNGLIDHTYDMIEDADLRMMAVFDSIRKTWRRVRSDPDAWRRMARPEAEYNYRHAQAGLVERMDQIMTLPLVQRMQSFVDSGLV